MTRQARDLVHFFVQGNAFLQVFELDGAADFRQDREGVRIPLDQDVAELDRIALVHLQLGAIHHRVALALAAFVVDHCDKALAIHHHQVAGLGLDRLQVDEADCTRVLGFQTRLLGDSRCRTADVEGTHRELRARLADGLRCDDAGSLAQFDQAAGGQVAAVAHHADTALRFAGQHGTDLHPLDAGSLNRTRQVFGNFLVDIDDDVAVVVLDLLERHAADNAVTQRFDDLAGFHDTGDVNAIHGAAVVLTDDYVLGHVDQAARQVARVRRLESGIGQSLTGAVRRNEILQHGQPFAEVRRDGRLDDFARRLSHQTAHSRQLANLLFRSASAGVGHDVNRIEFAFLVATLHFAEHLVGHFLRDRRPDFDDFVVALAVGDGAIQILLLDADHLLFGVFYQNFLAVGDDHVINADRQARAGCEIEPERLDLIQHLDRNFQTEPQVGVVDQLPNPLLLEQAIDVGHAFGKVIVQDGAAHRRVQEAALVMHFVGVSNVLIVVGSGQVDHFTCEAQADRRQGLHFARFQSQHYFIDVGERAAFALRARLPLGQVVKPKNHVLRGHGDGLPGCGRENVVRGQHQHAGFNLRFRR